MQNLFKNPFDPFDLDSGDQSWPLTDPGVNFESGGTAAVGDLGTTAFGLSSGGSGGSTTSGTAGAALAPTTVTTAGSGLVLKLDWDSSVTASQTAFVADVTAAAKFLESQITNAVTLTINVGYDEIGGSGLQSGALGESESNIESVSYTGLLAALAKTGSADATDQAVLKSLPSTEPVSGTVWVTTAQAEALGLTATTGASLAGDIGFGTASEFTYGDSATTGSVASGTYDFFSTAVHEMTEVMGRIMLVGDKINGATGYTLMDLLHYSGTGVRDFTQSAGGYVSINGGATSLGALNANPGGDAGDWASSMVNDAFDAYGTPGVLETISTADITLMDALGWNPTSSTPPTPAAKPPVLAVQTASQTWDGGKAVSLVLPATTFTDPQSEKLTYTAELSNGQALPSWLIFNATADSLSGTAPTTAQTLTISVIATDTSNLSVADTFTATILGTPIVSAPTPNQIWIESKPVSFALLANTFTDPQHETLTYKATLSTGAALPGWLTFNATTETFTGTAPATAQSLNIEVTATDSSGLATSETFTASIQAALTGITVSSETGWLAYAQGSNGLVAESPLVGIMAAGGIASDVYTYTLGGTGASSFTLTGSGGGAYLSAGRSGVAGAANGKLYALTITAADATRNVSAAADPINVVVGGSGADTINLASMNGISAAAPTFIYGLGGNDIVNGAGMQGSLFFASGSGADTMTGGSGVNDYLFGSTSNSTPSAMDVITNFNAKMDLIDLTGLGISLTSDGALPGSSIAGNSFGWHVAGGNTFVLVNSSGGIFGGARSEALTSANMEIELKGTVALSNANFVHY